MKRFDELTEPDQRNDLFVRLGPNGRAWEPLTLEYYYRCAANIMLNPEVPDDIRSYMETLKSLFVYGWYYYPFCTLAGRLVPTLVEMALRARMPKRGEDWRGLRRLFKQALSNGLIKEEWVSGIAGLGPWQLRRGVVPGDALAVRPGIVRANTALEVLAEVRNSFVHPEMDQVSFPDAALEAMIICGEIINQVWPTQ